MELLRQLSTSEIFVQIVSFVILLILMRIFVWKKLLGTLDARKKHIADNFKQIEDAKSEIHELRAQYEGKLLDIDNQARKRIQEAAEEGKKVTDQIRKHAHEEAQDIIEKARENTKNELLQAKEDLKNQIIDLTIRATEDIVQEKLTEAGDRKLIEDFLDKVDKV